VKGGNGDKTDQDQGLKDETVTATTKCTKEAAGIQ
jgi:hypothetical protein